MPVIRWTAPEYRYYEKDLAWYLAVLGIGGIVTLLAAWQKNFLFVVFTVLATLLALAWGKRKPEIVSFEFSDRGLGINSKRFYAMDHIEGFTLIALGEEEAWQELVLRTTRRLDSLVRILVPANQAEAIVSFLKRYADEMEFEESATEHIARILRF
ncbi:hypothetical protein HY478_03945 [Candidatus Uhrbacteria bacterium]|nr:hypothetical protein [Candidatus Uhrbacteria bacterium]